jgi:hypothetical protein
MAYDRADWHYGGDFPADVPDENGATHIGMFLAWAINNDFAGELHREDSIEALADVRERRITGRDFLINECDEKFWEEDLNDLGNAFARDYYGGENILYYEDYIDALCDGDGSQIYYVEDTWENYDKLAPVISRRFEEWKSKNH